MLNEEEFARVPEADRSDNLYLFKRKLGKKGFVIMAPVKLKVKTEGGE